MEILLNGDNYSLPDKMSISELIQHLRLEDRRLAVEVNQEIVPRSQHDNVLLQAGDAVEIVHAIGGG